MTEAEWWTDRHTSAWERIKEALKRDWEQTKADLTGKSKGHELHQQAGDTVKQAAGNELIPPSGVANHPASKQFSHAEPALRYGVGASNRYDDQWNETLEDKLSREWAALAPSEHWDEAKDYIRRGWEASRSEVKTKSGKVGWALLWLLGIPLPILVIFYLIRGH